MHLRVKCIIKDFPWGKVNIILKIYCIYFYILFFDIIFN